MHILVARFSSIGDVALCIPVIHAAKLQYPELQISVTSRSLFSSLFEPLGVKFFGADLKGKHKGVKGLKKLHSEIVTDHPVDHFIDLHDVLRTKILRQFFALNGIKTCSIDKGRKEKKLLTQQKAKVLSPLKHTINRYAEVFEQAGFPLDINFNRPQLPSYQFSKGKATWTDLALPQTSIGIAPTAAFKGKTWPAEKMERLITQLQAAGIGVLLFGGKEDAALLHRLKGSHHKVKLLPPNLSFGDEIVLMQRLKLMLSMDSANMHLAALAGIPVVSIWGATHPFAGFTPIGQPAENQIGIGAHQLDCRPCSVYGNKACFRKDYACLHWIEEDVVFQKILELI